MPLSKQLSAGELVSIGPGILDSQISVGAKDLASQTQADALASSILSPRTAWVAGKKLTGSLKDWGNTYSQQVILSPGDTRTIPLGYHSVAMVTKAATLLEPGENLLKNSIFVGGGSQGRSGNLPINTDGRTYFASEGETIDRWFFRPRGYVDLTLQNNGLKFSVIRSSNVWPEWYQSVANPGLYAGKTAKCSALIKSPAGVGFALIIKETVDHSGGGIGRFTGVSGTAYQGWKLIEFQVTFSSAPQAIEVIWYFGNASTVDGDVIVAGAKLELGTKSTLVYEFTKGSYALNGPRLI